jgi:hypothetical protein
MLMNLADIDSLRLIDKRKSRYTAFAYEDMRDRRLEDRERSIGG